jgi:hypothetical protein|tara:strand:+ start:1560 stop:1898 length:339 start_codon:yes stop_codon:yes gene_type:complete
MAKKAYLVLTHSFAPAPGANPSAKNFATEGEWQMHESIFFVTRIRKGWWQSATTIVNITESKIEKNNAETSDYQKIVEHVMIKYPVQYNQFIKECKEEGLISKGKEAPTSDE